MKGMIGFYIFLFFAYLFGPLMVMSVTAFNTPNYPQAYPFEGFTLDWFVKLWNHRAMMEGLRNSHHHRHRRRGGFGADRARRIDRHEPDLSPRARALSIWSPSRRC